MKRCVVYSVSVYFSVVKVIMHFFGVRGGNVVCCAPDCG